MLPFGKAAWAIRAVSSGTSKTGRGCKDIFFLQFLPPDYTFLPAERLSKDSPTVSDLGLVYLYDQLVRLEEIEYRSKKNVQAFKRVLATIINEFDLSFIAYLRQTDDEADKKFIVGIAWGEAQLTAYMQYLKGTTLLIDCLQLAAVSDRAGIEERLLLPASAG